MRKKINNSSKKYLKLKRIFSKKKKLSHNQHSQTSKSHRKQKKTKIPLFYKLCFPVLIIGFFLLFYFAVIVSNAPRSIPFVTKKIQENLDKNFNKKVTIENSLLGFTRYGTMKVSVINLRIYYQNNTFDNNNLSRPETKSILIPKIESEFSLLNFLFLKFYPSKIKIINPEILIEEFGSIFKDSEKNSKNINQLSSNELSAVIGFLSSIRKDQNSIENFEIENAKLILKDKNFNKEILLKKSIINIVKNNNYLDIDAKNSISLSKLENDVNIESKCRLSSSDGLECALGVENIITNTIHDFHPKLNELQKINATISGNILFLIKDGEFRNFDFNMKSDIGNFNFPDIFSEKIEFKNLTLKGDYDFKSKSLNLSKIEVDLISKIANQTEISNPHLSASLNIFSYANETDRFDIYVDLQNVLNDELSRFWPIALDQQNIRDWVINHIHNGVIKNAHSKLSLIKNSEKTELNDIDAQVFFSGFNLNYHDNFPEINNINGIAEFTKNSMNINLTSGDVLKTKISEAKVAIDNFSAPELILKISGISKGHASDGLKHSYSDLDFWNSTEKFLNGNSQSKFEVNIPLKNKIALKDCYIAVESSIADLNNDFVGGDVLIKTEKESHSVKFISEVNLLSADVKIPELGVLKKSGEEGILKFSLEIPDEKQILIKEIELNKKAVVENISDKKIAQKSEEKNNPKFEFSKISGEFDFEISPFLIKKITLKNKNFNKNNYNFSYSQKAKNEIQEVNISGQFFDATGLLKSKLLVSEPQYSEAVQKIKVSLGKVGLFNNKSVRNFSTNLNCKNFICSSGFVRGNYSKNKIVSLNASKPKKEKYFLIEGKIDDLGYIAESLDISKVLGGGNVAVKIKQSVANNKPFYQGELKISDGITVYESESVKKLSKDNLFSKIKDKIFASEKTIFNSAKVDFEIQDNEITINSMIANNFKIGITAKGKINLKTSNIDLKGMIIPGYLINSLFGIGKIPIIGSLISGVLTGGEKGGGIFGVRYQYIKKSEKEEGKLSTNAVSAFVPTTIQNLFE